MHENEDFYPFIAPTRVEEMELQTCETCQHFM